MAEGRLETYQSDARRYDELLDHSGVVRPHWRTLIDRLAGDGAEAVRRGADLARRLIVENGVTYNVYADPQGRDRPWMLDPLPLLLTAQEWREIELGVAQRARLLDALLADLYGPQHLLAEGMVPPELPFGHPNFLWPCHGLNPLGNYRLHVYAVDISRSADGRWWALADRTQTPSGPGYALENRQIVTRIFPDLVNDLGVRSLGGFFVALREHLLSFADGAEPPLAVVLTPGSFNETYFEHAYLARQLGLPLVEGHDLTVRGDTLFLKTLGGLRRVHAVLRRLDDDFCDPVELRGDSALGVPGLIGVVRAGRVVMANALGSGVLESAAWMGFMPAISERLFGEKLRLPSVATWWCGEQAALDYVIEHIDELVIKPTYPNQRFDALFGRDLETPARAELIERLRERPYAYVAQERLAFSQAPVWRNGATHGFAARALGIRVYAIATPTGYRVMPGGLARIAGDGAVDVVSMQRGGGSKDVWVLTPDLRPIEEFSGAPTQPRTQIRHDELPSRLVENLYWMGRYSERCDSKARLLRASLGVRSNAALWSTAVAVCRHFGCMRDPGEDLTHKAGSANLPMFSEANPLGVAADLQRLVRCASQARSRLSAENWRAIGVLQREFHDAWQRSADPREILDRMLLSLAALAGFAHDDMTQDDGWRLMMLGRRLERLQFLAELLAQRLAGGSTPSQAELEWLLDIGDSTITYRTRYLASPQLAATIDLLVFDHSNPRSLAFQWDEIEISLLRIAVSLGGTPDTTLDAAVTLVEELQLSALEGDSARAERARVSLGVQLQALGVAVGLLSDRLSLKHFSLIELNLSMVAA
ncbi:MAG: circularly permuted type 2 ATP-grasp protein [Steroidobacteraceae bacterium]